MQNYKYTVIKILVFSVHFIACFLPSFVMFGAARPPQLLFTFAGSNSARD